MRQILLFVFITFVVYSCSNSGVLNQRAKRLLASVDSKIKMGSLYHKIAGDYQLENDCRIFNHTDATVGTIFQTRFSEYKEGELPPSRIRGHNSRFILSSEDKALMTITSSTQEMESLDIGHKPDNYFMRIDKQGSKSFTIRISYDLNDAISIERNIIFANDYLIWMEKDHFFGQPQTCIFRKVLKT